MASKSSEYEKVREGTATVFKVTPAQAPKFWFMVVFGAILLLGGLSAGGAGFFFILMGAFCIWYGWFRDQRPKEHRNQSTFRVTAEGIEADGRRFAKDDIHRLILRNGITDKELDVGVMYNVSAAQGEGMARRARLATISNSLTVEAGGKATLLAGGMDEVTAYGLLREVTSILDFKERSF